MNQQKNTWQSNAVFPLYNKEQTSDTVQNDLAGLTAMLGYKINNLLLGGQFSYSSTPNKYTDTTKSNGIEQINLKSKQDSISSTINGWVGGIFIKDAFELGTAVGIINKNTTEKQNYDPGKDVFTKQNQTKTSGYLLNAHFQQKKPDHYALRMIFHGEFQNQNIFRKYDKANYDSVFGSGMYDSLMLDKTKNESETVSSTLKLYTSLVKEKDQVTKFFGGSIGLYLPKTTDSADNNTSQDPTAAGQQYTTVTTGDQYQPMLTLELASGIEGHVTQKIILRGGLGTSLLQYNSEEIIKTDKWDTKNLKLADTITEHNRYSKLTFFNNIDITGGIGFNVTEKLYFDVSAGATIFGIAYTKEKNEQDLLASYPPVTENIYYNIKLACEATYKF